MGVLLINLTCATRAVPEDAPANVRVVGSSPSSVFISWVPPTTPNGIITTYNLYISYGDGSPSVTMQSNAASTNYTVTGLQPYQLVSAKISASNSAGEGPMSDSATGRVRELGMLAHN